ncbi:MarR family winged helix-turn-helix transcriptional regulator [Sediminibacterium soli]|uniref:MarR family winged helix-turn-helix transcriptional regulator n=1 Tax=Sediminibacterium soli TaxID=2698829 RepID=UPI00137AC633|nr:MarR family transcriptional regulator [Sediminibacterium soli]NCI45510.1 MarR family transcriptional regulator [Sediminibacterium soli]
MKTSECRYCTCPNFLAGTVARKIEKMAAESWKETGLAPSHAYLLLLTLEEPGIQAGIIAQHLQLTPSTITRLVEKLEERKLVTRVSEGKQTNVFPTQKAREMKPLLKKCSEDFHEKYTELLGKSDSKQFIQYMTRIADRI